MLRGRADVTESIQSGEAGISFLRGVRGLAFYNAYTNPNDGSSPVSFERHFNPMLKRDSAYFASLAKMTKCVDKNLDKNLSEAEQNTVCASEMKDLRMKAFKHELLYHQVNKRFYMDLINVKKGEAPF